MKDTKKILCHFSFYDQVRIQEKLEEMAQQGWMVDQPGNFIWTFKRMEPKKRKFSVTYFPSASEFDPGPTDGELTKVDFCAQDGWSLAVKWGVMQIFYNEDEDAVPIETDPVAQVDNIRKAMRKNVLLGQLVTIALIVYYLVIQVWQFRRDPVDYLSSPIHLYQIPMWICLLLACLYELCFYFHWTRKAKKAAEEDGIFLPIKSKVNASYFFLAFSILLMLLAFGSSGTLLTFLLIWSILMVFINLTVNGLKQWMKKRGVSRRVNFTISVVSAFLLALLFVVSLVPVLINSGFSFQRSNDPVDTYEYHGDTWEIYDDPLPLEIGDLMEMEGNWSKEMTHQETGLLSRTEYEQRSLLTEPREVTDLSYTITDIKAPFLRNYIRQAVLDSRQDEVYDDFIFTDHYEPVDASIWNAEEAYQLHWSDSILDTYLVFWENRIVEITFYWEPTIEQITTAADILSQS